MCVLSKRDESPLECKEIQPVHPKEDQSWVFFGRNDAKAETPAPATGHWFAMEAVIWETITQQGRPAVLCLLAVVRSALPGAPKGCIWPLVMT